MKRRNFLKMFGLAIPAAVVSSKIASATPDVTSDPILAPDVTSGILTPEEAFIPEDDVDDLIDTVIPEIWAKESLHVLDENMVIGNLVYRDFDSKPYICQRGIHRINDNIRLAIIAENPLDSYVVLFKEARITIAGDDISMNMIQEADIPGVNVHMLLRNAKKLIIGGDTVCIGIPEFCWKNIESNLRTREFTVHGYAPRIDIM